VRAICFERLKMLSAAGVKLTLSQPAGKYFQGREGSRETSEGEEMMSSYCGIRAMNYLFGLVTDGCLVLFVIEGAGTTFPSEDAGVVNRKSDFQQLLDCMRDS
jgi:hypothetical protein